MAKKGDINLTLEDIKKENPLITIIKKGKIPVIRFSNKGFQNYKQVNYFVEKEDSEITDLFYGRGCFVHIGGVQANSISCWHCKETLNIGYVEPKEKIYITYNANKNDSSFKYMTAKERFNTSLDLYEKEYKKLDGKYNSYLNLENFDFYTEAIVDSTRIKSVIKIEPKDFPILIKYCNDDYFKIYHIENLFSCIDALDIKFKQLINYNEDNLFDYDFFNNQMTLKFFSDYFGKKTLPNNYILEFLKKRKILDEKINKYLKIQKIFKGDINIFYNLNYIHIMVKSNLSFSYDIDNQIFKICYVGINVKKNNLSLRECIFSEKKITYIFCHIFYMIYDFLKEYRYFEIPEKIKIIHNLYLMEKDLNKNRYKYNFEDNIIYIYFKSFIIEYHYDFDDIIIQKNKNEFFYPDNYFENNLDDTDKKLLLKINFLKKIIAKFRNL